MSCLGNDTVIEVKIGDVFSHLVLLEIENGGLIPRLVSSIIDPNGDYVDNVSFLPLDQTVNANKYLMTFDTTSWDKKLIGTILKMDIVLFLDNLAGFESSYTSSVIYIEVLESPTRKFLGVP